jgi:polyhydroxybutyrate depolymerase
MNKKLLFPLLSFFLVTNVCLSQTETSAGVHTAYLKHGNLERKFMYYVPGSYNPREKSAVVFFLHGMGASAQIGVNVLGPQFHARAERDRAIVIYPDAVSKHWNDKLGGSYPLTDTVDDVGFMSSLIDKVITDFNGDPRRVYISGSSNGGMMTYRLSCEIPGKIAAIAPFISTMSPEVAKEFAKAPPVPIIVTSGTADSVIKWAGGPIRVTRTPEILSAENNISYWIKRNHAKKKPEITELPDVSKDDNSTAVKLHYKGKHDVILYKIIGGAHQHPSLRASGERLVAGQNNDYNSFETVWDFMVKYRK